MSRPPATLHGAEASAYLAARQAIDIGKHRRTFTRPDFVRVVLRYLAGDIHQRTIRAERARAEEAEARARKAERRAALLAEQVAVLTAEPAPTAPTPIRPVRVAILSPLQAAVFEQHRRGKQHKAIAEERGMKPSSVTNLVHRASEAIAADNPSHAAWLVTEGVVEVRIRTPKRQRRAA